MMINRQRFTQLPWEAPLTPQPRPGQDSVKRELGQVALQWKTLFGLGKPAESRAQELPVHAPLSSPLDPGALRERPQTP